MKDQYYVVPPLQAGLGFSDKVRKFRKSWFENNGNSNFENNANSYFLLTKCHNNLLGESLIENILNILKVVSIQNITTVCLERVKK